MTINIHVMGSGSAGNCYRIEKNNGSLLIECGFPCGKIVEWLNYDISDIDGCLISHAHQDHARAAIKLSLMGMSIYASMGTFNKIAWPVHGGDVLKHNKVTTIGPWEVKPILMVHDCAEPIGFLIRNGEDRLLFATDTAQMPYRVGWVNYVMIECNYSLDILDESLRSGSIDRCQYERVIFSHFGLENVLKWLETGVPKSRLREIHLIHMSDRHIDPQRARSHVMRSTGVPTFTWR